MHGQTRGIVDLVYGAAAVVAARVAVGVALSRRWTPRWRTGGGARTLETASRRLFRDRCRDVRTCNGCAPSATRRRRACGQPGEPRDVDPDHWRTVNPGGDGSDRRRGGRGPARDAVLLQLLVAAARCSSG